MRPLAEGLKSNDGRGNWTPIELFLAGVRTWPKAKGFSHDGQAVYGRVGSRRAATSFGLRNHLAVESMAERRPVFGHIAGRHMRPLVLRGDDRHHSDSVADRTGRSAGRGAAVTAGVRRTAEAGRAAARPRKTWADASGNWPVHYLG